MPQNTSSGIGITPRRRKIAKACDFCREHRVRCEATTPCPPCIANNITCHRSRPERTSRKSCLSQNYDDANIEVIDGVLGDTVSNTDTQTVDASEPIPSPEANLAWTSHKTDSIMGFIARITVFCSHMSQTFSTSTPSASDPPLESISLFSASILNDANGEFDLSPIQIKHLMRIFWSRLRPQMPIVQLKDLENSSEHIHGPYSPLQDAVIAYTLNHIYHSGLNTRIVNLNWPQFQTRKAAIGMPYFQRCLSTVTKLATFAGPSVSVMQCYCYMTLYLLDLGHHQAAYNIVGLGLRIAESLNYMDARTGGYRDCQLFRRVWWTLIHLDFRCSRHLGKPVSIRINDLMCVRPTREPQDIHYTNGLLYHTESLRLTAAALVMDESMDRRTSSSEIVGVGNIESRAKNLSDLSYHLQKWRDELPQEDCFANLHFDVPDVPPNPTELSKDGYEGLEQSSMATLLRTLLSLQYHNVKIGLHRVFIQFPSYPLVPKSTPKADAHAVTALNHALTMIRIAHNTMTVHDFFHGFPELYQYQWNAVITIIGFMLACPWCHRCLLAREYIHLALEIFDSADKENATATRAAALTRHLCTKVDTLTQVLNVNQQPTPTSLPSLPNPEIQSPCDTVGPSIQNEADSLLDSGADLFWHWADLVNLDAWSSYCNEVNEAFMDPTEVFVSG
ncbi:uncharacterized protein N7483_002896 [Penicillium malachiteum]|uniref:uncharacterized protein n=1 Tax=Penicillium malachiteum TaxID=1324776 RepID=UPI00254742A4|nr:uncharacterized protein N7483_002896 [Penicillium malachiteum]KAJ5737771.1 hypothetical protein N7483_002896 [Penicillium malachiteum]